jgi:tRNA pseudouridine55 synthase
MPNIALGLIFPITAPKGFENPSGLGILDEKLQAKISISPNTYIASHITFWPIVCGSTMRIHGVLNLNKPPKMTSRQAVDRIRGLLNVRKAGHGGTLDPDATGVLLICLGDATRLFESLQLGTKEYEGALTLGITTDTLDASGQILDRADTSRITPNQIHAVFQQFIGEIEQVVPIFSAAKHKGKRLYKLARQGIEVESLPRKNVFIEWLEILSINIPEVRFRVVCSKGTYIRTLAANIGSALGCGAYLSQLVRTRSGIFKIEDSYSLDSLESNAALAHQAVMAVADVTEALNRHLTN